MNTSKRDSGFVVGERVGLVRTGEREGLVGKEGLGLGLGKRTGQVGDT